MEKFTELNRLCKRNELYRQKLCGIGIALFGIGLQAFAGEILFAAITAGVVFAGLYLFAQERIMEG